MYKLATALLVFITAFLAPAVRAETVWIDVRTVEEYTEDHIEGDTNIPLAELDPVQLKARFPEGTEFMLYCRSGNRAGQALELLQAAGFTNAANAGGIADVRKLREAAVLATSAATQASGAVAAPPR